MFADNSTLFCGLQTLVECRENLHVELHNSIVLNIAKTKLYCIVYGRRYVLAKASALNLSIDGISVEQVTKTKLLGFNYIIYCFVSQSFGQMLLRSI